MNLKRVTGMALKVGDRVEYAGKKIDGQYPKGQIVDVEKNKKDSITSYFVKLDIGMMAKFKSHNLSWHKLEE